MYICIGLVLNLPPENKPWNVATHFKNSMRIKNKKTNIPYSITYREWRTEYVQKNKYIHFDIVNYDDVVELHVIDKETGELKFNQILDKKEAENNVRQFSTTQYIKPLSFEYYDKNLVLLKSDKTNLIKENKINKKPTNINENPIKSFVSKFWNLISNNALISGLIILFVGFEIQYKFVSNLIIRFYNYLSELI